MRYYLAIDIGASSGRHILGWLDGGKMYTEEIYRFQNAPVRRENPDGSFSLFWDTERLFSEILTGLRRAGEIGKIPESVGIDTWGVDYVLLDSTGGVIDGVYCYRDARTEKTIPLVHESLPFDKLYNKTGIGFASFNTVYQLYDDKISGKMDKAVCYMNLPDYFHYRLTGVVMHEYTNSTTT